ncbi:MAG: DUF423 domain-containing protein [Deltaproteobacteria bacterium]|nr:MAG: DUF423 domain-containing protein [Deltaproteobacteria bacterium]
MPRPAHAARWIVAGAVFGALAVGLGAFGTHTLRTRLSPHDLETWRTAVRYLQTHALALVGAGLFVPPHPRARRLADVAGATMVAGTILFAGAVAVLAVGGPRWLGAVAPVGGTLLIAGWIALAAAAWTSFRNGPRGSDATCPSPDGTPQDASEAPR